MCPIRVETGLIVQQALVPQEKTCRTGRGEYCPMYKTCGGQRQRRKRADVWVVPRALLTLEHGRPEMIGRPRGLVVDESCRSHVAQGFGAERSLMLFEIGKRREVPGEEEDTEWLHRIMENIERALTGAKPGPNGEIEMRIFTDAGLDFGSMERAVNLLYATKALVAFRANDPEGVIEKAEKAAAKKNGKLPSVIQLAKIIKWGLARGDKLMRGCRFQKLEFDGSMVDGIRMRWFMLIHPDWEAPALHLDATGRAENVRRVFPRLATPIALQARIEHAHVRQIIWQAAKNQWGDLAEAAIQDDAGDGLTPEERRKAFNLARSKKTRENNVKRILNYALGQEFRYRGMGVKIPYAGMGGAGVVPPINSVRCGNPRFTRGCPVARCHAQDRRSHDSRPSFQLRDARRPSARGDGSSPPVGGSPKQSTSPPPDDTAGPGLLDSALSYLGPLS
jgi:hypothetical protein